MADLHILVETQWGVVNKFYCNCVFKRYIDNYKLYIDDSEIERGPGFGKSC